MPVGEAPHRPVEADPGAEVRLEMCELAVAGDDRLSVSRIEVDRPGPSYTVDTLRELAGSGRDLVFVMGADQALAQPRWHDPQGVVELATLAVAERDGRRREEVRGAVASVGGAERLAFFDMPRVDVSASLVRRRVAEGRSIRYLVPDPVARYVAERGLYAGAAVGAGRAG